MMGWWLVSCGGVPPGPSVSAGCFQVGWGVVLVVWSAMVLLLRQVLFSCIMSVVVCSLVFMVGLLRRIHA